MPARTSPARGLAERLTHSERVQAFLFCLDARPASKLHEVTQAAATLFLISKRIPSNVSKENCHHSCWVAV